MQNIPNDKRVMFHFSPESGACRKADVLGCIRADSPVGGWGHHCLTANGCPSTNHSSFTGLNTHKHLQHLLANTPV